MKLVSNKEYDRMLYALSVVQKVSEAEIWFTQLPELKPLFNFLTNKTKLINTDNGSVSVLVDGDISRVREAVLKNLGKVRFD